MASRAMLSLVAEEDASEQRRSSRFRVMLTAKLVTTTSEHPVRLRDLSATGALAEGASLPPEGKDVVLKRGTLEAFARVVWSEGGRCGLEFEEEIPDRELLVHLKTEPQKPSTDARVRRPSLRGAPLTPEELAIVREWAQPQGRSAFRE